MKNYIYKQISDEDGHVAVIQFYIDDAQEYVENILTDGSPEMESYAYELGYRAWWDDNEFRIK